MDIALVAQGQPSNQYVLLQEVLVKVSADEMGWIEAREILTSLKKPWTTKEWKEARKGLLGAACESCGTTTPPLVLQHTWHPTPLYKLFYAARRKYRAAWDVWRESHPLQVDLSALPADEDGCPRCGSTTIRHRKRSGTWVCAARLAGVTCGHVFEAPLRVISPATVRALERTAAQEVQDTFDEEFGIGRKVITKALEGQLRYLSLKDTKTLCKRCAFVEDRTRMILCTVCREKYHSKKYDRCSSCAGVKEES
jgi:uncharacterized paraquat-inducible protein A